MGAMDYHTLGVLRALAVNSKNIYWKWRKKPSLREKGQRKATFEIGSNKLSLWSVHHLYLNRENA